MDSTREHSRSHKSPQSISEEPQVIKLTAEDSATFLERLCSPVHFNDKLIAAFKEYDQRVASK